MSEQTKATLEDLFGSDFEESEEEKEVQEEVQSTSDKEEEVRTQRVTRTSEKIAAEKERQEEEQKRLETQKKLEEQARIIQPLLYNNESDGEGDDSAKSVLEINHTPRPFSQDTNNLYFLRTPVQFNTDEKEYIESETNLTQRDLYTIRYRKNDMGQIESNTRVVEYEDGTFQVFVGNEVILDLDAKPYTNFGNLHLFEKVNPFCYYSHGIFTHRLNTQATSTLTKGRDIAIQISKGNTTQQKKKVVLTTKVPEYDEAKKVQSEVQDLKKKQQKKQRQLNQKLTMRNANLEEGAGSSSDEEGNVRKIKKNTLRKNTKKAAPKRKAAFDEEESADTNSSESEEEYDEESDSSEGEAPSKSRRRD